MGGIKTKINNVVFFIKGALLPKDIWLIPTFACFPVRLEHESHWAAAVHTCGSIMALAVTASVVHSTGFWKMIKA